MTKITDERILRIAEEYRQKGYREGVEALAEAIKKRFEISYTKAVIGRIPYKVLEVERALELVKAEADKLKGGEK